jgi:hypothetical protein
VNIESDLLEFEKIQPSMEPIARRMAQPTFSEDHGVKAIWSADNHGLVPNLLSYVLYLAVQYKLAHGGLMNQKGREVTDSDCGLVEQVYADVIGKSLFHMGCNWNHVLWNENGMWNSWKAAHSNLLLHQATNYNLKRVLTAVLNHWQYDSHRVMRLLNTNDMHGKSVLHYATNGHIAQQLLLRGASLTMQDDKGNTPVHTCPTNLLPLLLAYKPNLSIRNREIHVLHASVPRSNRDYPLSQDYDEDDILQEKWPILFNISDDLILVRKVAENYRFRREWVIQGLTPVMESIAQRKIDRLDYFFEYADKEQIQKQIGSLRRMAACAAIDDVHKGKEMQSLLQEYERKTNIAH